MNDERRQAPRPGDAPQTNGKRTGTSPSPLDPIPDKKAWEARRDNILSRFGERMSVAQRNLLSSSPARYPATLAYNPKLKVLRFGAWWIGAGGIAAMPGEGDLINFMSGEEK